MYYFERSKQKKIYIVTTDYEPISGNEIIVRDLENSANANESQSENDTNTESEILNDFGLEGFAEAKTQMPSKGVNVAKGAKGAKGANENNLNDLKDSKDQKDSKKPFTKLTFVSQNAIAPKAEPKSEKVKPKLKFSSDS